MVVRPAHPIDVPAIAELVEAQARRAQLLPRSIQEINATLADWIVGEDSGRVIGCVSLLAYSPQHAEVRSLVVADSVRGHGLGSALVKQLVEVAGQRRIPTVFALTRAVPFFLRNGFQVCDKTCFPDKIWRDCQRCPLLEQCDETAMVLDLAGNEHTLC